MTSSSTASNFKKFVYDQVCWVRMSLKHPFYPARVVNDEDLNEKQMWKGVRPLYSVKFFDAPNLCDCSAFHVCHNSLIEMWPVGIRKGFDRREGVPVVAVQRAVKYRESQSAEIFEVEKGCDEHSEMSSEKHILLKVKRVCSPPPNFHVEEKTDSVGDGVPRSNMDVNEKLRSSVQELSSDDLIHISQSTGFLGVNSFSEEMIKFFLARTDTDITAVWDSSFEKCAEFAKRIPGLKNDSAVAAETVLELYSNADVIFCCLEEEDLLQEHNVDGRNIVLLEHIMNISRNLSKNTVIIGAFHPEALTIVRQLIKGYMPVKVLGVGFCGCIGSAECLFVSGDINCYQECRKYFIAIASSIVFTEGNPSDALLRGAIYNYFTLSFARECYATRLFAEAYGMDILTMKSFLPDCLLLMQTIFSDFTNDIKLNRLNRFLGTMSICKFYADKARSTVSDMPRKYQDLVGIGSLNKILSRGKFWSMAEAFEHHFQRD